MSYILPKRPNFIIYNCKNELKEVIKNALKDKDNWSSILGIKITGTNKQFSIKSRFHKQRKRTQKKKKIIFEDIEITTRSRSQTIRNSQVNQILLTPLKAVFPKYELNNAAIEKFDPSFPRIRRHPMESNNKGVKKVIDLAEDTDFDNIRFRQRSMTRR